MRGRAARSAAGGGPERQRSHLTGVGERQLLGDHAPHRDPEHVCRVDLERRQKPRGVLRELGDRERAAERGAGADAAVVVGDHVEVALQPPEERLAPVQRRAAHAHDQEQRRARAAALAVEHDLTHADRGHEPIVAAPRYTGSPSC